jgi:hypothetical protein
VATTASAVGVQLPHADEHKSPSPPAATHRRSDAVPVAGRIGAMSPSTDGAASASDDAAPDPIEDTVDHGRGLDDHPSQGGPKGDDVTVRPDAAPPGEDVSAEATHEDDSSSEASSNSADKSKDHEPNPGGGSDNAKDPPEDATGGPER